MATKEELQAQADEEIDARKPMYKGVDGEIVEYSDADYEIAKTDLGNLKWEEQQFGYIESRKLAYKSIPEQLDMQYWDGVNSTTNWADHIAKVKSDNPKPE